MSNLIYTMNHDVPRLLSKFISWAQDRKIIKGATAQQQFPKLLEEVIELYATLHPEKNKGQIVGGIGLIIDDLYMKDKINQAPPGKKITDDVGDCTVVLTIMAEQKGLTMQECMTCAWYDIKDRGGEMQNGIFVKESDLIKKD